MVQSRFTIFAENSPFDMKDHLKARGYRWNGDGGPQPRAWYVDVPQAAREAELKFLHEESEFWLPIIKASGAKVE